MPNNNFTNSPDEENSADYKKVTEYFNAIYEKHNLNLELESNITGEETDDLNKDTYFLGKEL